MFRFSLALALMAAACSGPKVTTSQPPVVTPPDAAGAPPAAIIDASIGFGFDPDALPAASDGGSAVIPVGPGSETPSCANDTHQAEQVPLDLLLLVDTSGSMNDAAAANQSKWQLVRTTLGTFWSDPQSAGLGMGLQFFPVNGGDKECKGDGECTGSGVGLGSCNQRQVCAGATLTLPARGCGLGCANGTTCVTVGRCALSGGDCLKPGTPCPTGAAGDTCLARGTICDNIGSGSCTAADYQQLAVPITPLPAAQLALTQAMTIKEPIGFTPTTPAVSGALDHLRAQAMINPGHKMALVLMTDGLPIGCTGNTAAAVSAAIMAARTGTPAINTYVIGVFGDGQFGGPTSVDQWAAAGGTGMATVLRPNADFARNLLATLNGIRGAALPCEFAIPPPRAAGGKLDYGKVNVRYSGAGAPLDIGYVGTADRCDATAGGWYYDADPRLASPTRVLVCPATCNRYKGEPSARVDLIFGCATKVIE
jgi:hypothetical protein